MVKRCVLGTVVGGFVLFVLGYLIFGIAFVDFFRANAGSATGVERETPDFLSLAGGQLVWGGLLTILLGRTRVSTIGGALKIGAIAGLMFFLGMDLTLFATTHLNNLTATLVDPILTMILFAVAAAAIFAVTGRTDT